MTQEQKKYSELFPEPNENQWRELAIKALKGADFDKTLTSRTLDGIEIRPLYTEKDALPSAAGVSGRHPFACDINRPAGQSWRVGALVSDTDPKKANVQAIADLEGGATSLVITVQGRSSNEETGVALSTLCDWADLMADVDLSAATISLDAGASGTSAAAALLAHAKKSGADLQNLRGALNVDPIGGLLTSGQMANWDVVEKQVASVVTSIRAQAPGLVPLAASASVFHEAGATEGQEIAFALAEAVAYLRALDRQGLSVSDALSSVEFVVSVDNDFFSSIAKIRALRKCWARVAEACGSDQLDVGIQAVTSARMMTRNDPWVNILRTTTAGFAAAVAGADQITIRPYTEVLGASGAQEKRLARNIQTILSEESFLSKVIDPGGGAWYIESLTQDLAQQAWAKFQSIEQAGGILKTILDGTIQKEIRAAQEKRVQLIHARKLAITGVSEFPNLDETLPRSANDSGRSAKATSRASGPARAAVLTAKQTPAALDFQAAVEAAIAGTTLEELDNQLGAQSLVAEPLVPVRLSEPFEALRGAAESAQESGSAAPTIFLANWGALSEYNARATFSKNFFEVGGLRTIDEGGFENTEALTAAFGKSGSQLAVICSTDERYQNAAADVAKALIASGAKRVFIAGHPSKVGDVGLSDQQVGYIYAGANIYDTLTQAHATLGLKS